jgi:hypothetical protein
MAKYTILHSVTFTTKLIEGVAEDKSSNKFWVQRNQSNYDFYPMSEIEYRSFHDIRKEFCKRSGEPLNHGDPLIIYSNPSRIGSSGQVPDPEEEHGSIPGMGIYVNCEKNSWNFNSKSLMKGNPIVVSKKDITNLCVPFEIIYVDDS